MDGTEQLVDTDVDVPAGASDAGRAILNWQ